MNALARKPMTRRPMKRRPPTRTDRRRAAEYAMLRRVIFVREAGRCARCSDRAELDTGHCHHRQLRGQGGPDTEANCVWLCPDCHEHVHANPAESTAAGWLVSAWATP